MRIFLSILLLSVLTNCSRKPVVLSKTKEEQKAREELLAPPGWQEMLEAAPQNNTKKQHKKT